MGETSPLLPDSTSWEPWSRRKSLAALHDLSQPAQCSFEDRDVAATARGVWRADFAGDFVARHLPDTPTSPRDDVPVCREGGYASGSDFSYDDGDIVVTATSNGYIDQRVDDPGYVRASGQGVPDVTSGQFVEETVAAHDDSIPFFNGKRRVVDLESGPTPSARVRTP